MNMCDRIYKAKPKLNSPFVDNLCERLEKKYQKNIYYRRCFISPAQFCRFVVDTRIKKQQISEIIASVNCSDTNLKITRTRRGFLITKKDSEVIEK